MTCRECASWPPELTAARFAFELAPPADDLVHGLKYEGWRELAGVMGDAMASVEIPGRSPGESFVVVPVPTTPERLRARGYNQAGLLAERVALRTGLSFAPALARPTARGSQTSLAPEARRDNVRGAFEPTGRSDEVRGRSVLLVDDVLTTGATISEAAVTLARAGAVRVVASTFARALGAGARAVA